MELYQRFPSKRALLWLSTGLRIYKFCCRWWMNGTSVLSQVETGGSQKTNLNIFHVKYYIYWFKQDWVIKRKKISFKSGKSGGNN